jgi:predicted secreted protein
MPALRPASMLTTALLALLVCVAPARAQEREPLFNLVNLNAQAEREVANDTLVAVLAAEAEGADPAALADGVNRSMREALRIAQSYKQVRTRSGSYQTSPVYDKARIVRWRVRQELRLESADFAAATELVGRLQSSLVVARMSLGLSNEARRQVENALISEAIAAFNERAGIVRDALKAKAYRVKDLHVGTGGGAQPRAFAASAMAMRADAVAAPAIEAGTSQIMVTVSGSVQLQ